MIDLLSTRRVQGRSHTPGIQALEADVRRSTSNTRNIALVWVSTLWICVVAGGANTRISKRNEVNGEIPAPAPRSAGQGAKLLGWPNPSSNTLFLAPLSAVGRTGIPTGIPRGSV